MRTTLVSVLAVLAQWGIPANAQPQARALANPQLLRRGIQPAVITRFVLPAQCGFGSVGCRRRAHVDEYFGAGYGEAIGILRTGWC